MSRRDVLKLVHFASTAWLGLCVVYLLVLALRQAGFRWWVIFSFSGYSLLLVILFINLYLFAIFKSFDRSQKIEIEHPLSTTIYYDVFYSISPLLGGLAGYVGTIGLSRVSLPIDVIALGTLATTFLVWIIVDPTIHLVERQLPTSRKHRVERLARVRALQQKQREERKRLLVNILAREEQDKRQWQRVLQPYAEKLAGLLTANRINFKQAECGAVDIGVKAWQMGGLSCMRQLREMAMAICKKKHQESMIIDYVSTWWDGIGDWRSPSLAV